MHVFEAERWGAYPCTSATAPDAGPAAVTCAAAETVFDYCWFPRMLSSVPESCCFATTSRDQVRRQLCATVCFCNVMLSRYSCGTRTRGGALRAMRGKRFTPSAHTVFWY
jgi:hypothetical protein